MIFNKTLIAGRLFRKGALKRNLGIFVLIAVLLSAAMAHFALSESSVYDKVSAGDYIDTGLDTTRGISMDLVEKGLTHKVLEFEITPEIAAQDIQLLVSENNFDATAGSLSKLSVVSHEDPVYETVCNPYDVEDAINGSINTVQNCTTSQAGTRTVEVEEWAPVETKASEENAGSSLATFNILEKGRYRYSFEAPIVQNSNGWGNAGTVFLKVGDVLYADKQHSSWWNSSCLYRTSLNVLPKVDDTNFALHLRIDTTGANWNNNLGEIYIYDNRTNHSLSWVSYPYNNASDFNNVNTTIFTNTSVVANEYKGIEFYYGCTSETPRYHPQDVGLVGDDFNSQTFSASYWEGWGASTINTTSYGEGNGSLNIRDTTLTKAWSAIGAQNLTNVTIYAMIYSNTFNVSYSGADTHTLSLSRGPGDAQYCHWGRSNYFVQGNATAQMYYTQYCWNGVVDWGYNAGQEGNCRRRNDQFQIVRYNLNGTGYNVDLMTNMQSGQTERCFNWQPATKIPDKGVDLRFNASGGISAGMYGGYDNLIVVRDYGVLNPTYTVGTEEIGNMAPIVSSITISPATAYTADGLNCSFTVTDENEGQQLTANVSWYKNDEFQFAFNIGVTNGTLAYNLLDNANTTKGETWNCSVIAYDGYAYSNASSAARYINDSVPAVDSYNTSSLNRTDVEYTQNVTYQENETTRFAVEVSDADDDEVWYSWFVDNVFAELTQNSWFDKAWGWLSSGLHTVRVDINDTSNAITTHTWYVDIANVPNIFWTVEFVSPTPSDGATLASNAVNISAQITPRIAVEGENMEIFNNATDFTGTFENTQLNATSKAIQLTYPQTAGTYTSPVYDAGEAVVWDSMKWSEFIPVDGETDPAINVKAIWYMNEQNGYITDSSDNANDGTAYGGVTYNASGMFHSALEFDSDASGHVIMPSSDSLNLTDNLTIQAWIKTGSVNGGIVFKGVSSTNGDYALMIDSVGRVRLYLKNLLAVRGTASVADSSWHHVAATYDGSTAAVYVDGIQQDSDPHTQDPIGNNEPMVIGRFMSSNYFNGIMDEVVVWDKALNSSEVFRQYNAKLVNLTFQAKTCDDAACVGESFAGPLGASSYYSSESGEALNAINNRYLQYKAFFETNKANLTASFYNVTFAAHTNPVYENVSITNAWLSMNGANTSMSGSGYNWNYTNSTLLVGSYTYKVYANDSYGNVNVTETRSFTVPSYNITFNVTSGEDGGALNNVQITCDYSGFSQGGDTTNMYGAYELPVGSWTCSFEKANYYNTTLSFVADQSKVVNVILSFKAYLTVEEHDWLKDIYDCLYRGDCNIYDMVNSTNQNVSKIWQQYLPTDENVVLQEDTLSSVLTATNDISINYTIAVPYKEGYANGDLLPVMLSFWFTDATGKCYNQDKQTTSNRAESPYCIPLIAEYLGLNNGTVNFKVDLHPSLADGSYNVVRSIDIDPPVNGNLVWINYGRENIGTIDVRNPMQVEPEASATQPSTVQAKAPILLGLSEITGNVIDGVKSTGSLSVLVGLGMICLTFTISFLGRAYIGNKSKQSSYHNEAGKGGEAQK